MRAARLERTAILVFFAFVLGGAGWVRPCLDHGVGVSHDLAQPAHLSGHGLHQGPPQGSAPCDHNLGVCQTLAAGPLDPESHNELQSLDRFVSDIAPPAREFARPSDPFLLLPYSTGPPAAT